jgi:oligoendopeptidase F
MSENAKKIPSREEIDSSHTWDLSPLFKSHKEWEDLFEKLEKMLPEYQSHAGKLGESLSAFKNAIEFDLQVSRDIERLYTYAHLKSDEDKTNQHHQGMYQRVVTLAHRAGELSSFLTPEIQSIPESKMQEFIKDPSMEQYGIFLERILRMKPHTLDHEKEELLATLSEIAQAPSEFFSQLDNADMQFGSLQNEKGEEIELSHGNFINFLMSPDRNVRKNAFFQYYRAYQGHRHSISSSLAYSIKKDFIYSRVRKFDDCRSAALFSDNMPEEVYDNLLATVRENLRPLFNYLDFRKKALGLESLHFYDTYVPIISDIPFHMTYEDAVTTCCRALAPLGNEYVQRLEKGLLGGWVDRYENRGKRSGAYSSGCYDSPPYILMNYHEDNINSLYTLIHEAGHSMHSLYAIESQPYLYHDYTIFVAEVASTFNEALLSRYLLDQYSDDPRMQAYIINREIDNIRGTLYRQTMFAEFEKISHNLAEKSYPLTLDTFTGKYGNLLEQYFGESMVIDDVLPLECLRIPHFYSAYYVYKYATGISAAIALAEKVLSGGDESRDRYLAFLKMGGSKWPLEELQAAGVDMRQPEPVIKALNYFDELVSRLKDAWNHL